MFQFLTQNKILINLCWNFPHKTKFGSTSVGLFSTKKKKKFESSYIAIVLTEQNSDQPMLKISTQNKIRINLCWNFPHKTKFGSTSVGLFSTKKIWIKLCCNCIDKTKFGSTYTAIFHIKQNFDQPILQFSTQNKILINLCCNFPHKTKCGSTSVGFFYTKRKKLGSSYIAIVLTKQNPDQPMLQFSTHKKKFGSTYVAIFHTHKKNSD